MKVSHGASRDCKVDVAEPQTKGFELSLLLQVQQGGEHCRGAREQFLTTVLFFCCELQVTICL
jgi:hypothetical protein